MLDDPLEVQKLLEAISQERLALLADHTKRILSRSDGLLKGIKEQLLITCDILSVESLHQKMQKACPKKYRITFAEFLRRLAEAEDGDKGAQKGGAVSGP